MTAPTLDDWGALRQEHWPKPESIPRNPYTLARAICEAAGLHACTKQPEVVCGCAKGECRWKPKAS